MTNEDAPWKDEELLRKKYCVEGLSIQEIADEWDTTFDTIRYYKDKFEIEGRPMNVSPKAQSLDRDKLQREYWGNGNSLSDIANNYECSESYVLRKMDELGVPREIPDQEKVDEKYKKAEWLETKYWRENLTLEEIGEIIGCSASTVGKIMENIGVERNDTPDEMPPNYRFGYNGYEKVRTKIDGKQHTVCVHQLVAIANGADPYKVFSDGKWHVHHKNKMPADNSHDNLELLTKSEHHSRHYKDRETNSKGQLI